MPNTTADATDTLELALKASGCKQVAMRHEPNLLSDNGVSYVSDKFDTRYHESLSNVTPADVHTGRGQTIRLQRERTQRKTFEQCRLQHRRLGA